MTRDTAREIAVNIVFSAAKTHESFTACADSFFEPEHYETLAEESEIFSEQPDKNARKYIYSVLAEAEENLAAIDGFIEKYSRSWGLSRISGTALAILRVAVCEIMYINDVPIGSAINSAVEIDKGYDEAETVSFVNGVLGAIVRGELSAGE